MMLQRHICLVYERVRGTKMTLLYTSREMRFCASISCSTHVSISSLFPIPLYHIFSAHHIMVDPKFPAISPHPIDQRLGMFGKVRRHMDATTIEAHSFPGSALFALMCGFWARRSIGHV